MDSIRNKKRLTIAISQVAPLIGLDNYGNFPRIVCELWRKINPSEFREFELNLKNAGFSLANSSEMNDIWEVDEKFGTNILEQVQTLNTNTGKTSHDMTKTQFKISEYINTQEKLSIEMKTELIKKVCSITNKLHGVNNENIILDEFCRLSDKTIQKTQGWVEIPLNPTFPKNNTDLDLENIDIEWVLVGKYDGITTDGELVEAKMRQKNLFKSMRDYENVQVQLYLHALGFQNGFLVEGFSKSISNKKQDNMKQKNKTELNLFTHEIKYDSNYVKEIILARLNNFIKYFNNLMLDTTRKENILKNNTSEWTLFLEEYLDLPQLDF